MRRFTSGWILRFLLLLLYQKKYMTMLVGLGMGVVYMLVDYGVFHLICHSRSISAGHSLFGVLLWMSMSYGFTNFTWIWLCLSKDEHLPEWSLLILSWWFCCPLLTQTFVLNAVPIVIQRTTGAYHGYRLSFSLWVTWEPSSTTCDNSRKSSASTCRGFYPSAFSFHLAGKRHFC